MHGSKREKVKREVAAKEREEETMEKSHPTGKRATILQAFLRRDTSKIISKTCTCEARERKDLRE